MDFMPSGSTDIVALPATNDLLVHSLAAGLLYAWQGCLQFTLACTNLPHL